MIRWRSSPPQAGAGRTTPRNVNARGGVLDRGGPAQPRPHMTPPSPIHRTSSAATAAAWFLGLYGLLEFVPGLVHFLLPDGGARVIAGLDLAQHAHVVIGVFAWMGAVQIAYGLGLLAVAATTEW